MKVLTAEQMREVDKRTFEIIKVSSLAVMESAGRAVINGLLHCCPETLSGSAVVLTGAGNNAGDGYVIARALLNLGVPCVVGAARPPKSLQGDSQANAVSFVKTGGKVFELTESNVLQFFASRQVRFATLFVDALLGTGVTGAAWGVTAQVIEQLNEASKRGRAKVVSVDIPSGVSAATGKCDGACVRADLTFTLQCPKVGNVLFPGSANSKELWVVDIGLHQGFVVDDEHSFELLDPDSMAALFSARVSYNAEAHKSSRGDVLLFGGAVGHVGAIAMAADAALRAGAGVATIAQPKESALYTQGSLRELISVGYSPIGDGGEYELGLALVRKNAIVIGPGMGQSDAAAKTLEFLFEKLNPHGSKVVLDADALNLIANTDSLAKAVPPNCIMTPHPGELARLLSTGTKEIQGNRIKSAQSAADKYNCWVVLKGARTVIASPRGHLYINLAATEALATAGSGDVLAGVIGAFLARGLTPMDAVRIAVYLHGRAGELLYEERGGAFGVTASDIAQTVPRVINRLSKQPKPGRNLIKRLL